MLDDIGSTSWTCKFLRAYNETPRYTSIMNHSLQRRHTTTPTSRTARPSRSPVIRAKQPPCIRQQDNMQPHVCSPEAERAPSSNPEITSTPSLDHRTPRPDMGVRPARPHEDASRAFSYVGGTGRKVRHLTTCKQATSQALASLPSRSSPSASASKPDAT
jgi:hypothetical protein